MSDGGSSVTLILYSLGSDWWTGREPLLNIVAAAAQRSTFTHVELAIGEDSGSKGEMVNVLRIFNDNTGVELTQRTGKNPNYQYVQLGCSKAAERAMLAWSRSQVGKPFSSVGMIRSIVWPRNTDTASFYCAELVAACLKVGGLMSRDSNPGNATPASLHALYKTRGAVQANPYTLRRELPTGSAHGCQKTNNTNRQSGYSPGGLVVTTHLPAAAHGAATSMLSFTFANSLNDNNSNSSNRMRAQRPNRTFDGSEDTTGGRFSKVIPPKQRLVLINGGRALPAPASSLSISLSSLDMTVHRNA